MSKRVLVAYGTRPEAIKLAPVVLEMRSRPEVFDVDLVSTSQHDETLAGILEPFSLAPNRRLGAMEPGQPIAGVTARVLESAASMMSSDRYDIVVVQGDTATTLGVALAAFYARVPVAHIEAGLRTGDLSRPFPEEAHRKMVSVVSRWHLAPTDDAARNLLAEGIDAHAITVTGNTIVDAMRIVMPDARSNVSAARRSVLVTLHRRESCGIPAEGVFGAIGELADRYPAVDFIVVAHPNGTCSDVSRRVLEGKPGVTISGPMGYLEFLRALASADFVISDSGGVQEEACSLGVPVLLAREVTERPEAIEAGIVRVVGLDPGVIGRYASELLDRDGESGSRLAAAEPLLRNPFGDGRAAMRICDVLEHGA